MNPGLIETDDVTESLQVTVTETDIGSRLDKFLALQSSDFSRTRLKQLIEAGECVINGKTVDDASYKLKENDNIIVSLPPLEEANPEPENIPLDILYEDEHLLVINKAAGMVVHPAVGNRTGTLVNALLYHCGDTLSGINGIKRPGIVHRLDKETSGLMMVAKSDLAHHSLSAQLQDKSLSRVYEAYVFGVPHPAKGQIEQPIGRDPKNRLKMTVTSKNSKEALTYYKVEESFSSSAAKVECRLSTGRTHQIRVHFEYLRHPLIGDPLYSIQKTALAGQLRRNGYEEADIEEITSFPRQSLHAREIAFIHPATKQTMNFNAEQPIDLKRLSEILKKHLANP